MASVEIRGLWKGQPIAERVELGLDRDLCAQQKQIAELALTHVAQGDVDLSRERIEDVSESAVDFAMRLGFTKLDYYYEENGREIVVDVLDPSKAV